MTEQEIREIVRDELKTIVVQAEAAEGATGFVSDLERELGVGDDE